MASLTRDDYTIAWVCALPVEAAAARAMLDKIHHPVRLPPTDPNAYVHGELNGHHIVIACLPAGIYGTVSAASVMAHTLSTFPRIQFALMVGIGGGVPGTREDIRLGDVVVSQPGAKYSGVIQYDYGKTVQGGKFEQTGMLNQPPQIILTHMAQMQAAQMTNNDDAIEKVVADVFERNPDMRQRFGRPSEDTDQLFAASYHHPNEEKDCDKCDKQQVVPRRPRDQAHRIHYGLIASGDQVMKDSETRDRLSRQLGVLCFEMEAAGLMNQLPTLVIRGICDYCDSHKQKNWQGHAALAAAAYTKNLLSVMSASSTGLGPLKNHRPHRWIVPLARNPRFVGRQDVLMKLEELIETKHGPSRVAITGLGGVGKTQVALELAYRMRDRDKSCFVVWIPCTSLTMIDQTYLNLAQTLGFGNLEPIEARRRIKAHLSSECAGKWLLIFDNADDKDMWLEADTTTSTLEDALPRSEQGRILFTTRNRQLAVDLASSNVIGISDTDQETALQILEKSLVEKTLLADHIIALALLEELIFLPLAISQASAYINKNGLNLSTYLELLREEEHEVVGLLSEDFRDEGRYKDIQNPVISTWLISFKQIQQQNQLAADYLSFMACINPRNIPSSLLPLPPSGSKKCKTDALGLLSAYSFTNAADMDVSLHRLVHIATRNWLRKNTLFSHWIQRVADQLQHVFPNSDHTNRGLWRQYLPHALSLVNEDEFREQQENHIRFLENIADCLSSDGRYHEAELLYTDLMKLRTAKNGYDDHDTLTSIADLATIYWEQGRWNEAEELDIQVLERRKIALGPEHPKTLSSMSNLASTYQKQGRWNEAEKLEVEVLKMSKTMLGPEHPDTLTSMANLASIYQKQGRWNEAEKLEVEVLEIRKTVLGTEHPKTLSSMSNLASTYEKQGRWNKAEELQIQVLKKRKSALGSGHPNTLSSMEHLASIYWSQGRWNEAEELDIQVLEKRKTVLGPDHPKTLSSMANLVKAYRKQGRWNEAETLGIQVLDKRKAVLGSDHPNTLDSMADLASTYWKQGHWSKAEDLEIQVLEKSKTVLGSDHPDTLSSMANLASTYRQQGRWNEAEQLEVEVLELSKIVRGTEHPYTLVSMENLAYTWKSQGKVQVAYVLMEECYALRNKVLGSDHPDTTSSSQALSDWKSEYDESRPVTPTMQSTCRLDSQTPKEISDGAIEAAVLQPQSYQQQIMTRTSGSIFVCVHPLMRISRKTSLAPTHPDLEELD